MIRVSDLPSFCEFKTLEPLEGQGTGELALQKHLPYIRHLCQCCHWFRQVKVASRRSGGVMQAHVSWPCMMLNF